MRTRLLLLGACVLSCTSAPAPVTAPATTVAAPSPPIEYSGVYISTPDEDIFTPCGSAGTSETWSLSFRGNDPDAPFLKKVTALRGYMPLTHFVRVRGKLGPPGRYNLGFQTRELAVDRLARDEVEPHAPQPQLEVHLVDGVHSAARGAAGLVYCFVLIRRH